MTDRHLRADQLAHARRTTGQPEPALRERVTDAIRDEWSKPADHRTTNERFADAAIAVIGPELDKADRQLDAAQAEIDGLRKLHGVYEAARLGNLIGLDEKSAVAVRGVLAETEAELHRYRAAWQSARHRAAKASGTLDGVQANVAWLSESHRDTLDLVIAMSDEQERLREQAAFIHAVLDLAQRADFRGELLWHSDGASITIHVDVSDVFAWGGSDAELLTPERLPLLAQAVDDLRAIHPSEDVHAVDLYAARLRGMRPQGAAYPKERAATQALFDACGPERPTELGNPRPRPTPRDQP